ncbi:MAG: hypothetical protein Q4B90_06435 [Eubacteriales bacterium]|nr:hypothetical protein [Eubacteriales bacterium]
MDFFEKLNNLLTEAGKEAEQRVKEVSDSMRLNSTIREEKNAVKEYMERIGRLYYEEQKGEGTGIYKELFDRVHKSQEAIRKAQKELEEQKKKTTCQCCGAPLRKEDLFCSRCGTPREMEADHPEETEETRKEESCENIAQDAEQKAETFHETEPSGEEKEEANPEEDKE